MVEADEAIRPDTNLETLAKLKAVGGDDATHTAGNSPGVNDGAGAVVVASEEWAKENGKTPIATVLSYGQVADDFPYLARTPAKAAKQALEKIGKSPERRRPLGDQRGLRLGRPQLDADARASTTDKVNVNGGAIALGHPIGASGARIVGALVHELRRRGGGLGCAAICSGGGQGDAIVARGKRLLGSAAGRRMRCRSARPNAEAVAGRRGTGCRLTEARRVLGAAARLQAPAPRPRREPRAPTSR